MTPRMVALWVESLQSATGTRARTEEAQAAWMAGLSLPEIATALGVTAQTAWRMINNK